MPLNELKTVTVNDICYNVSELSQEAKSQLLNLYGTDQEIKRLKQQLSIAQTARITYAKALELYLPAAENLSLQ